MTKEEKVYKILKNSIFNLIPEPEHAGIIEASKYITFKQRAVVNDNLETDALYVLLDGKVDLIEPESGMLIEAIAVGRSIELETLIKKSPRWKGDWVAKEDSSLLGIPFIKLLETLKGSNSYAYLERIVLNVELQKLKNDLRLLGVMPEPIQKVIATMNQVESVDGISPDSLVIVRSGGVKAKLLKEEGEFDLKNFSISDYFILKSDPEISVQFADPFEVWTLPGVVLNDLLGPTGAIRFLDILEQKKFEVWSSVKGKGAAQEIEDEEPEEDDGLKIEDFYKENPLSSKKIKSGKPVHFRQYDQMDCGAACMSMISHYYHRKIKIPSWRSLVHVTREGASMLAVKRGAARVGFDSIGIMSGMKSLNKFRTPFIALMAYHYIVIYEVREKSILAADPGRSLLEIPNEEFEKDYSKNCLLLRPTESLLTFPESSPAFKKYLFLFKSVAGDFAAIALFSVVLFVLSLAPPLFTQFIFDQVLKTGDLKMLNKVAIGAIALTVFMAISGFIRTIMLSRMTNSLGTKLSSLFFRHVLGLPYSYFSVRNVGDVTTRVGELDKIRSFFTHSLIEIFMNLISLILYLCVLYVYHPSFSILAVGFMIALFICVQFLFKKLVAIGQVFFYAMGKNHSVSYDQLRSLKTIQTLVASLAMKWKWEETYDSVLKARDQMNRYRLFLMGICSSSQQLISVAFIFLAVQLFNRGELTIGQVVAVNALASSLLGPIIGLIQSINQVSDIRVSFEKIDEIVTSPLENRSLEVTTPFLSAEKIEFKGVWFQYGSDMSPWVLKGVNLEVKKGEKIAFVGPSGSGKSTIAYMLNLIYRPTKGDVLIDGVKNIQIDLGGLRKNVAMVLQDHTLFPGSVINNIAFGDEFPDLSRVVKAAKVAEAHDFIAALPAGYSTELGDGKLDLSGGQKQRINIARAVYRNPTMMVLDEATSALDTLTEKKVLRNLKNELKNTTCFTIAHRLNTIIDSDRIVVVNQGKVAEQGRHEDLMKLQGVYFDLFRKQLNV